MRLFVAITLPSRVRALVRKEVDRARVSLPPARWVGIDSYHFTLVFLGEREVSQLPALDESLLPVFSAWEPFRLHLHGAGSFPANRPSRVLWIGVDGGTELERLQTAVQRALLDDGLVREEKRPYHPHLTVARCRQAWSRGAARRWAEALPGPLGDEFEVDRGVLFESRLNPNGAGYEALRSYPFAGPE